MLTIKISGHENADISILCPIKDEFGHKADKNSVSGNRTLIVALRMLLPIDATILRLRSKFATVKKLVSDIRALANLDAQLLVRRK